MSRVGCRAHVEHQLPIRSFSVPASRVTIPPANPDLANPQSADAHAQAVRTFAAPAAPAAPVLPTDLAAEMSKFDATEPVLGAAPTAAPAAQQAETGGSAQQFLEQMEADLPKNDHH